MATGSTLCPPAVCAIAIGNAALHCPQIVAVALGYRAPPSLHELIVVLLKIQVAVRGSVLVHCSFLGLTPATALQPATGGQKRGFGAWVSGKGVKSKS